MRIKKRDGFGPRIGRRSRIVDRARIVVETMGGSLIQMQSHRLSSLNHARDDFRDAAVLVVVGLRKNGQQLRIQVVE